MRTIYLECGMGAAGDMLTAALLELLPEPEAFTEKFRKAGIPGVEMKTERTQKCGITGTHVRILVHGEEEGAEDPHDHVHDHAGHRHDHAEQDDYAHDHADHDVHDHNHDHTEHHSHAHHHSHHSMHDIGHIVEALHVEESVKKDVLAVYRLIAEAESRVHGKEVSEIHFHEVGSMDAVADVTAVCMLMRELAPDQVIASPVATGFGTVNCAHGILPVPAPATALLLQGIPSYAGRIEGELCTPTGAALLKYFADRFEQMPVLKTERIGYGMGRKDFARANCVRAFLGETEGEKETVYELACNVDDMTGEEIGFATERLFAAGAREVFTSSVYMKKNRPGILLQVLAAPEDRERLVREIFKYTTTLGIREAKLKRYVLDRKVKEADTPYGTVRRKEAGGYGVERSKWEYEDIARIAAEKGCSVQEIREKLNREEQ